MKKRPLTALAIITGMLLFTTSIVWAQVAPVAKTGQTISYRTGDDGYHQPGVASPAPRFTDNGDGTVTDNQTGLMWAKNPNAGGTMTWDAAIDYANNLRLGGDGCGSSNTYEDWRLPNRFELESLLDLGNSPAFPSGHPFLSFADTYYWSSNTYVNNDNIEGWCLHLKGYWCTHVKTHTYGVWPVRLAN